LTEHSTEIATKDRDPLRVDGTPELSFTLDVDESLAPESDDGCDAHGLTELDVPCAEDGQSVHDADAIAAGIQRNLAADGEIADMSLGRSGTSSSLGPGGVDVVCMDHRM
jgi:hypothetical protein